MCVYVFDGTQQQCVSIDLLGHLIKFLVPQRWFPCRSLAARGYQVLHIDSASSYGLGWGSLNLLSLERWVAEGDLLTPVEPTRDGGGLDDDVPEQLGDASNLNSEDPVAADIEEITLDEFYRSVVADDDELHGSDEAANAATYKPLFVDRRLWYNPFRDPSITEDDVSSQLRRQSNLFNFDLSPKVLYADSPMVDVLITSGAARYLEFRGSF